MVKSINDQNLGENGRPSPNDKKLHCPQCNSDFLPRWFNIEKFINTSDPFGSDYNIDQVIIKSIYYSLCPTCSFVLKFAHKINRLKMKKGQTFWEAETKGLPCKTYLMYTTDYYNIIAPVVKKGLNTLKISEWFEIYELNIEKPCEMGDPYKFVVQFMRKIEELSPDEDIIGAKRDTDVKIRELGMDDRLTSDILRLNDIRNDIVGDNYTLRAEDIELAQDCFLGTIIHHIAYRLLPSINECSQNYNFLEKKDRMLEFAGLIVEQLCEYYKETKEMGEIFEKKLWKALGMSGLPFLG